MICSAPWSALLGVARWDPLTPLSPCSARQRPACCRPSLAPAAPGRIPSSLLCSVLPSLPARPGGARRPHPFMLGSAAPGGPLPAMLGGSDCLLRSSSGVKSSACLLCALVCSVYHKLCTLVSQSVCMCSAFCPQSVLCLLLCSEC